MSQASALLAVRFSQQVQGAGRRPNGWWACGFVPARKLIVTASLFVQADGCGGVRYHRAAVGNGH